MERFLFWFGLLHVAVYAFAAFSLATMLFVNWAIDHWHIKVEMIRAYAKLLEERREAKAISGDPS